MAKNKTPYTSLRYFIVAIILVVVLACILPFFLKGPDDQALISPDQVKLPEIKVLKDNVMDIRPIAPSQESNAKKRTSKVYKWKDKNGVIHFTDYPNPEGSSEAQGVPPKKDNNGQSGSKEQAISGSLEDE